MPRLVLKQLNLAVLIDAENAQTNLTSQVLLRAACYGSLVIKRAYADWTRPQMRGARAVLHRHAIEPIQMFQYVAGKVSADAEMMIDAVELMCGKEMDGFCLVTSDSDFTPVAMRMRQHRLKVYGFGARHTAQALIQACDRFVYVEDLVPRGAPIPTFPQRGKE